MAVDKHAILTTLSLGQRVAEDELQELASYFVETDQWRKVLSGEVDVIFGPKGSGKSAIYSALAARKDTFLTEGVILVSAERPQGTPAFKDLVSNTPTSEDDFVGLWKIYVLTLIGSAFVEHGIETPAAKELRDILAAEGLLPAEAASLGVRVRMVLDYVRRLVKPKLLETTVSVDPSGAVTGFGAKITLSEPSEGERSQGYKSVDSLLADAGSVLTAHGKQIWVLFDRLDVAFSGSRDLEANALRALLRCYLDLKAAKSIGFKIFLRTDIWRSVTEGGFREASHVTRTLTISWSEPTLLNLVVRRLLKNEPLVDLLKVEANDVLASAAEQRRFFDALVPDQVDVGNNPRTFGWILGRVKDGTGTVAPREVIHLLTEARDAQSGMLERGEEAPPTLEILSRQALREALPPVSRTRLEQTVYAEYPELKPFIVELLQEKTEQTPATLGNIWTVETPEARSRAEALVEIGLFERRGPKYEPRYWVPFLYRSGLDMVQGSA